MRWISLSLSLSLVVKNPYVEELQPLDNRQHRTEKPRSANKHTSLPGHDLIAIPVDSLTATL